MDEQDRRNKYPSIPANYVTLVDLQERWLKEKERKQRYEEKEEKEAKRLEQKEKQPKQPRRQWRHHNRNSFRNGDAKIAASHVSVNRLPARANLRRQSETNDRTIKLSELKPDDSNAVVNNGEGKVDECVNFRNVQTNRRCQYRPIKSSELKSEESALENAVVFNEQKANLLTFRTDCGSQSEKKQTNKKKSKWRNKKQSAMVEDNLSGGTIQVSPKNEPAVEIPAVSTGSSFQKAEIRSKFRRNEFNLGKHGKIWEPKVLVDETGEIGQKIEGLSLHRVTESNVRCVAKKNQGYSKYKKDYGRFNGRKLWKTRPARDANLAWVKKGEISGNNVDDFGSSGSMTKAGEGKKKASGQF